MNFNTLIAAAEFSPKSLQAPNAWIGHLPFAAWVIQELSPKIFVELGTHTGNSYFSFCQSVFEAALSTKCYAVDTWQGDEHAGQYDDEIFAQVNVYHQENYAGFSRLLRMSFDDAVTHFADESIGLLHIDGLHTYEAVKHDFETWLPKLAPGAVVMLHDSNVHERNFGVWKFWHELQASYPGNMEFVHSHGLGVLQLNNSPTDKLLVWLQPDSPAKQQLKNYFSALGTRQLERYELSEFKQTVADRDTLITHLNHDVIERSSQNICEILGQIALPDSMVLKEALNSLWYLQQNPDIANAGVDCYKHWLSNGRAEGRIPAADPVALACDLVSEREKLQRWAIGAKEQEILKQKLDAAEQVREASQLYAEYERELHEKILTTQQDLRDLELSWGTKASAQEQAFNRETQILQSRIGVLEQALQKAEQEKMQHMLEAAEQAHEAGQAHTGRERELNGKLLAAQQDLRDLELSWGAKASAQEQAFNRETQILQSRIGVLEQTLQKAEQEKMQHMLEAAEQAHEAGQVHTGRERELNGKLLAAQQDLRDLELNWAAKASAQEQAFNRESQVLKSQIDALKQTLLAAGQEKLHQELEAAERQQTLGQLKTELDTLRRSRSWRWTAPVRNLATLLMGKKGGGLSSPAVAAPKADEISSPAAQKVEEVATIWPQSNVSMTREL